MSINSFDTISSIYSEMVNNELVITLNQADTHNPPMIIKLDKKDYYNITYRDNDGNKQVLENVVITDAYMSDGSNPDKYTLNLEEGNYRSLPDKIYKYERDNNEELILKCSDVLFYNDIKTSSSHFKDSGIKINLPITVNEYLNLINYKKSIRFDAVLDDSGNIQWTLDGKNVELFYDYCIELDYNYYQSSINDGDYIILETSLNEIYEKDNKYIPASSIISINKHTIENNKDDGINIVYKLQNCNCNGKEKYDSNTNNIEIELYPDDGYKIYSNNIRVYLISSMESVSSNFISFSFSDYNNTITLSNGINGMHPYIIISVVATKIIDEPYIYTLSKDKSYYIFGSDIDSIEDMMSNKLQLSDNTYVNHAAFDYNCSIPVYVHLDKSSESFDIEFDKNPYYNKHDDELEYTLTYHEDNGWHDGNTYISDYDLENTYGITIIAGEPVENDSIHIVFKRISNIVIPEYYNGLPVKAISSYALMYSEIENIEIPNTIEYIGDEAFGNNHYIKKIIIPDSVKNIGIRLFDNSYNIDTIYLSNQMSCIPKYTFFGCGGLINLNSESSIINIPSNIKVIEEEAFYGILGYIKIPKSIIEYNGAFKSSDPYYVELEYGLKTISDNAFVGCNNSLKYISIPDSVTSIGNNAFKYCNSLLNIDISDSVISIGDSAFEDCTSLINIDIPDSVTSIGDYAFHDCYSLISITIPDSVTSIGDHAFYNCSSLTNITIPDSVTSIGNGAFRECSSLTSITIPDSVTTIGDYAFYYCNIDNLILGTGLKEIGYCGFSDNSNLVNVHVPKNVDIANYAFQGCGIEFIELDDDAYKYPDYLYAGTSITEIIVPENIKYLGKGTFENSTLTTITIHEDITELPYAVFNNCSNLEFTVTDNIVSIGDYSINVNNVSDYSFLNKLSRIPSGFFKDSAIEEFEIPNSVTSIGDSAFESCSSLISVTIPNSVTSIGDSAFYGCTSLITITLPDSVITIRSAAFKECTSLEDLYIYGTNIDYSEIDSKSDSIVSDCDKDKLTIHVKELPSNEYWNYIDENTVATTVIDL